jgi:hypothetical protein
LMAYQPFTADKNDGLENIVRLQITRGKLAAPKGQLKILENNMGVVHALRERHGLTTKIRVLPVMKLFNIS